MITKTNLKDHGNRIEQYFDYILETQVNNQKEQVNQLIKAMSQRQKNHFAQWLDDPNGCLFHHSHIDEVKSILFSL